MIDDLLDVLNKNPNYRHFLLDGRTILLQDYLEIRQEQFSCLKILVEEGCLVIGPWYVLPDEFLVIPEPLIRNLIEGILASEQFGKVMQIGFLTVPFGHIAQMPQILN